MSSPINVTWNGESFEPANRFWATKCDQRFVVGQAYTLDEVHARSHATHAHYFSVLHDIWQSLPERMAEKFPTEEHLRKYALIRTGYRTETQHVCKTPAEAERLAAAIRPYDTYQIVTLNDLVVTVYNAVSQDLRSMDKPTFQNSKVAVLDFCSDLIGLEPKETRRLAGIPVEQSDDSPSPPSSGSDEPPHSSPEASDRSADPDASTNSNTGENPAPVSGEPTPSESPPPVSETTVSGSPAPFRFDAVELQHLKDFARKALDDAISGSLAALIDDNIERMRANYYDAIASKDGRAALAAMRLPIDAVISGKRTRDQAENYIARDLMGCDVDELRSLRNG